MSNQNEAYGRVQAYGSLWLNDVFVVRNSRFRLWRKSTIRLSLPEMLWIGIITILSALIIFFVTTFLHALPGIGTIVSPFVFLVFAPLLGWFGGRRIARASPYRRYSGEGLGAYLMVQSDKRGTVMGRVIGRRIAVNHCVTFASGKRETVQCVEWVGTARSPLMPKYHPRGEHEYMEVELPPRDQPVEWIQKHRGQREQKAPRRSPQRRVASSEG